MHLEEGASAPALAAERLHFSRTMLWVIIKIKELASNRLRLSSLLAVFSSWAPVPSAGALATFFSPSPADHNELLEGREGQTPPASGANGGVGKTDPCCRSNRSRALGGTENIPELAAGAMQPGRDAEAVPGLGWP